MRITREHVLEAITVQNERGTPEDTATYLDFDEAAVIQFAESIGITESQVFAGAVTLGIEIERALQQQGVKEANPSE